MSFDQANDMMRKNPVKFKEKVKDSLIKQAVFIKKHTDKGTYFFDYGNAFLLEASRAGADVMSNDGINFKYPSYVQDIMGPMCFDYGFGPFRWVCTSGDINDLNKSDEIACEVLERLIKSAPEEVQQQMKDNIKWIKGAQENKLVVGSKARILYADSEGRIEIAKAFNNAIKNKEISAPIVLGETITMFQELILLTGKLQIFTMALHLLQIWLYKMLLEIHLEELHG